MRVAIVFDMEGTSHIRGLCELYPMYPEYWRGGRQKLTNDVIAAARGLIDGGAQEVVVVNHHGAGEVEWPNAIPEQLPPEVRMVDWSTTNLADRVDVMFQVGVHARGGSASFHSHTILPGLRLRDGDELVSESHVWAWSAAVPVIGMVGSEALESERGSLGDVPFLAVQRGEGRVSAVPILDDPDQTAAAIRAFAYDAIVSGDGQRPRGPRAPILEASLQNGDQAADAMGAAGWERTSRTEFRRHVGAWAEGREPVMDAIWVAAEAAWEPYSFAFAGIDPSTEETGLGYDPEAFARTDSFLHAWTADQTVEWITPALAVRFEGMGAPRT